MAGLLFGLPRQVKREKLAVLVVAVIVTAIAAVSIVMIMIVIAVPAARVVLPAALVVVPMIVRVIGVRIRWAVPAATDPPVVIALGDPVATDPIGTLIRNRAGVLIAEWWRRSSDVDADLGSG